MRYIELSEFLEWLKNGDKEYPTIYTEKDIFEKHKEELLKTPDGSK